MNRCGRDRQVLAERFELIECIKRRAGGEAWRGVDRRDGSPVVVKLVPVAGMSSATRLRLEHEARVMSELDLAARPVTVGRDASTMFLVQSFVEGVTLEQLLVEGPLACSAALRVGIEVLEDLSAAHERGVVHRDVKPANIMVTGSAPAQSAALIDFGLASSSWLDPSLRDASVGTARYLAPEAAGLIEVPVDERSDLYSVGVVLYECVTGQPPFAGSSMGELLRAHASHEAVPLRQARRGVPAALEAIVARLLAKDPAERYQSAAAVIADLKRLAEGLESGVADPLMTIGTFDRRTRLTEPTFIGRARELAAFGDMIASPPKPRSLILVEAESGAGKSRLLDEVCLALEPGTVILRGNGADRVARRPFQILDGVVSTLADVCREDSSLASFLAAQLGSLGDVVARALPDMAEVLGRSRPEGGGGSDGESPAAESEGSELYGEARTINSLCLLLDSLAASGRSVVVVLDDVQWADTLTVKLLTEWPDRAPAAFSGDGQLVIVAAFRSEEVGEDHPLRAAPAASRLSLSSLDDAQIVSLCESMAGPTAPDVSETVARLSEGSPFMAAAVMRGLVESDLIHYRGDRWTFHPGESGSAQTSLRAALVLSERLRLLSAEAQALLAAGAVLGKEFDLDQALGLADLKTELTAPALEECRRRRVVWVDERSGRCFFTHDKLREKLLEELPPQLRRDLHRRAAETLGGIDPAPHFELAYHLDAAGLADQAFPHAMAAADAARGRQALDVAIAQYRIAERGAAGVSADARCDMHAGLGEVLGLTGDYTGAETHLDVALKLADGPINRSRLEGRLGDVAFRRGDQAAARSYVEQGLRQLGRWVPRRAWSYVLGALWEILVQAIHSALPWGRTRRSLEDAGEDQLAARLYSRLAYVYWFSAGRAPCAWSHLRGMNLVERYQPSPELAQAWSEHGPAMTMVPWFRRAISYARKSYDLRVALGDEWGQGQSLSFYGVALYGASRFEECIVACEKAVELLGRMGDRWEENTARWHIAFCQYRLGDLDAAQETARGVYVRAAAIGDQTSRGIALSVWSRAAAGEIAPEMNAAELERGTDDAHTAVEVRLGETVRLIRLGQWEDACSVVDQALEIVSSAGLRQEYVIPAYAWSATARRGLAASLPAVSGRARALAVRRARRTARRAVAEAWMYRNNLPHALREAALVAAMSGRDRRAARLVSRSIRVARAQGAGHEAALSEEAAREIAGAPSAEDREVTDSLDESPSGILPQQTIASGSEEGGWSLSLADRFSTLLETSRQVSAAPSPGEVYQALRQAGERLLRAERCHIIELVAGADVSGLGATESGNPLDSISVKLIGAAVGSGGPVIAGDGLDGDSSESLVLSDARSTLCAPIYVDEQPVAVLYAMSRQLSGLFGEQEGQLASLITSLAGANLERVAGSEARFRSLVRNSSDVITIVDDRGVIGYQSESATRVFGADPEDMLGKAVSDWVHPDDVERLLWPALPDNRCRESDSLPVIRQASGTFTAKVRVGSAGAGWRHVEMAVADLRHDPGVNGIVLNTRDISEQVALENELRHQAWHDVVTGLPNRAAFGERVDDALARYRRHREPFAVLFIDLDEFKSINDTLGHATGDQVLRIVAGRLVSCVRANDTVSRFGGDEFAVLLQGADAGEAVAGCTRMLGALSEAMDLRGRQIESLASIGVATHDAADSAEGILAAADAALYVAKARGKHRFEMFEPSMRAATLARAGLRAELEHAAERGELRVLYQPVVEIRSGDVVGFEALARWDRPHGMVLGPEQFIPLAEESGAIVGLGAWVLKEACRQARRWRDQTGHPLTMAVNVSARQLLHPSFLDQVLSALDDAALEASALELEITESATVRATDSVISKLDELKAAGVGLAIDDFGTGYSALSYLHRLPVDVIKIDRSFVSGLGRNTQDVAIIQAIVNLAGALGLQTVAEGVETLDQLEILSALGCSHAQGYNWKRPCPAEEVSAWMAEGSPPDGARRQRLLIVDDSTGLRASLKVAIDIDGRFEVVGEAGDGAAAVELARRLVPDVVLLDLMMPGSGGLEVLVSLRQASPATDVVILSASDPAEVPAEAILAVRAVLDKTRDLSAVIDQLAALGPPQDRRPSTQAPASTQVREWPGPLSRDRFRAVDSGPLGPPL